MEVRSGYMFCILNCKLSTHVPSTFFLVKLNCYVLMSIIYPWLQSVAVHTGMLISLVPPPLPPPPAPPGFVSNQTQSSENVCMLIAIYFYVHVDQQSILEPPVPWLKFSNLLSFLKHFLYALQSEIITTYLFYQICHSMIDNYRMIYIFACSIA